MGSFYSELPKMGEWPGGAGGGGSEAEGVGEKVLSRRKRESICLLVCVIRSRACVHKPAFIV